MRDLVRGLWREQENLDVAWTDGGRIMQTKNSVRFLILVKQWQISLEQYRAT